MKKLSTILAAFVIFLMGCSTNENNILGPETNQLSKKARTFEPVPTKVACVTQEVDGIAGGKLVIDQMVLNSEGQLVYAYAQFKVSNGAFEGTEKISMKVNVDEATVSFHPHMVFNKPCKLDFQVKDANLDNLGFTKSDKKVRFVYFKDTGGIEDVPYFGAFINYSNCSLRVKSAELSHFSRYGFIR